MILSYNRPVTLKDVGSFLEHHGRTVSELSYWLGVRHHQMGRLLRRDAKVEPRMLLHHRAAMILRWLDAYPGTEISFECPRPTTLLRRLQTLASQRITQRRFALVLGYDASAAYRWKRCRDRIDPSGQRILSILNDRDDETLYRNWRRWIKNASLEARLRGVADLRLATGWPQDRLPKEEKAQ